VPQSSFAKLLIFGHKLHKGMKKEGSRKGEGLQELEKGFTRLTSLKGSEDIEYAVDAVKKDKPLDKAPRESGSRIGTTTDCHRECEKARKRRNGPGERIFRETDTVTFRMVETRIPPTTQGRKTDRDEQGGNKATEGENTT